MAREVSPDVEVYKAIMEIEFAIKRFYGDGTRADPKGFLGKYNQLRENIDEILENPNAKYSIETDDIKDWVMIMAQLLLQDEIIRQGVVKLIDYIKKKVVIEEEDIVAPPKDEGINLPLASPNIDNIIKYSSYPPEMIADEYGISLEYVEQKRREVKQEAIFGKEWLKDKREPEDPMAIARKIVDDFVVMCKSKGDDIEYRTKWSSGARGRLLQRLKEYRPEIDLYFNQRWQEMVDDGTIGRSIEWLRDQKKRQEEDKTHQNPPQTTKTPQSTKTASSKGTKDV